MTPISPLLRTLAIVVAVVLAPTAALAQPAPATDAKDSAALAEARSLYLEGNAHYSAGRYALAAERFLRAYELSGAPALLFNLANTYERAGDYEKAARYLRMYLESGHVHDAQSVKARLNRLELAVIELQKDREVDSPPAPAVARPARDAAPRDRAHRPSRVPYLIAGGGLVTGVALSVTFGLLARGARDEIDALCQDGASGLICPAEAGPHLDDERRFALVSDLGTGLAVASIAAGAIYFLATRGDGASPAAPRRSVSVIPTSTGDGLGVVATGRF